MQLRDYQQEIAQQASDILDNHGIVLLTMQVRTGKTLTALHICHMKGFKNVLFVTKKSIIDGVLRDYNKFNYSFNITVTSYGLLHKLDNGYDCVIVDEHHSIGAYPKPSIRAKNLRRICGSTPVILLSGTPTPESFSQAFHALWISNHSPWAHHKTFYHWFREYGVLKHKFLFNRQINDYSTVKTNLVLDVLRPLSITYTQSQAGFETSILHKVIEIDAPELIERSVKKLLRDKIITTKENLTILADTAVKEQNKVSQLWSGTIKTEEGKFIIVSTYKADFIKSHFAGKKIAIFYKYIAEGMMLRDVFGEKVKGTPHEFNESTDGVYISQIVSGREGINLSSADCLVMFNVDFSALSYLQAPDRINTRDRVTPAYVYWIVSRQGIEKRIIDVVRNKEDYTNKHYRKQTVL